MFTLHRIAFAPQERWLVGAIFVTNRSCASPISKVECTISDTSSHYSQFSSCGHPDNTDSSLILCKKKYYRRLTEMNSRYYGFPLMRTLTRGTYTVSAIKEVYCIMG